jgi:hypothetical protein
LDPDSIGSLDPDPVGQKMTQESLSAGCSLLRAEGFSCSLDVLSGGHGIRDLQILIQKKINVFPVVVFF